jgi:hypothetical protein
MMKLSKDNLVLWKILFTGMGIVVHLFFIVFVFSVNFWAIYLAYLFIATLQIAVGGIWRYALIKDVYLNIHGNSMIIEPLYDKKFEIPLTDIVKQNTHFGITNLTIMNQGIKKTIYFIPNSKENLKLLKIQ